MATEVMRVSQEYSRAYRYGDEEKLNLCRNALKRLGVYEQILYRLEKYGGRARV